MAVGSQDAKAGGRCITDTLDLPEFSFSVPRSVYGTAVMAPLLKETSTCGEFIQWKLIPPFWLCVNLLVQTSFLIGIYDITLAAATEMLDPATCEELDFAILAASLWVFVVVMLTDVQQTFDMVELFLRRVPTVPKTAILKYAEVDGNLEVVEGGLSVFAKVCVFSFVLLPKLVFAGFMVAFGLTYLVFSQSDADVVLNCTALCFVIEVDEFIYNFFSMPRIRRLIEACPAFTANAKEKVKHWFCWRPFAQPLKLVFSFSLTYLAMVFFTRCGYQASNGFGIHEDDAAMWFTTPEPEDEVEDLGAPTVEPLLELLNATVNATLNACICAGNVTQDTEMLPPT